MKHFFLALLFTLAACSGGGPSAPGALSAAPVPVDPQQTGTVSALITGGFTLFNGSCGHVHVFTSGSTFTPTGYTPHVNDNVTVSYTTGSCATSITATNVLCNSGQCGGTSVQAYKGCQIFASTDLINSDISTAAIDTNSSAIISNLGSVAISPGDGFLNGKAVEQYNPAPNPTPTPYTVQTKSSWNPPIYGTTTMPWQSSYFIEPLNDGHGFVLTTNTCKDYEAYQLSFNGTTLSAYSGHYWDLTQPMANQYATPEHSGSSNAADLPYIAMSLYGDRDATGPINHVIGFRFPTTNTAAWGYVRPADSSTGVGCTLCYATHMIYGERLRLHSSFTLPCITGNTCPQTAAIVAAAKQYGFIYYDQAQSFGLSFFDSTDGTNPWNSTDLSNLSGVHISDFDVISRAVAGGAICPSGKSC